VELEKKSKPKKGGLTKASAVVFQHALRITGWDCMYRRRCVAGCVLAKLLGVKSQGSVPPCSRNWVHDVYVTLWVAFVLRRPTRQAGNSSRPEGPASGSRNSTLSGATAASPDSTPLCWSEADGASLFRNAIQVPKVNSNRNISAMSKHFLALALLLLL